MTVGETPPAALAEPYTEQFSDWAGIPTLDRAQITASPS
ncbi:hypothetical protein RKD20_003378 [Streptomyces sp. SLBN-8D4]|jgi:hypothetical protein